jgi:hypothetical protein
VPNVIRTGGCRNPINARNPNQYVKLQCFTFPQPSTLLGNLSRNSLTGPGLSNLDLSLFKDNYIKHVSDKFDLQLRMEAFNILNRANFAPPLDHHSIFDENGNLVSGAGLIDSTATPSRQIQLGVKIIW